VAVQGVPVWLLRREEGGAGKKALALGGIVRREGCAEGEGVAEGVEVRSGSAASKTLRRSLHG
jgi:hypothetical protein